MLPVLAGNYKLFGNVALIAPVPGHKPSKLIEPLALSVRLMSWQQHWLKRYLTWLWMSKVWQQKVCQWFDIEQKPSLDFLRRLFSFLLSINYIALSSSAQSFEDNRVPLLYVYSDSDELIDASLNAEFAEMFGAHHSDSTDVCDAECQPKHLCQKTDDVAGSQRHYVKVVRLGCPKISQMDPSVADIILQELRQLYKHRMHVQQ